MTSTQRVAIYLPTPNKDFDLRPSNHASGAYSICLPQPWSASADRTVGSGGGQGLSPEPRLRFGIICIRAPMVTALLQPAITIKPCNKAAIYLGSTSLARAPIKGTADDMPSIWTISCAQEVKEVLNTIPDNA